MSAIAVVQRLHRWIGLLTGAVIVVASLTGAVLVYGIEIQRTLEPHLWELADRGEAPLSVSAWLEIIGERHPQRRVRSLEFASNPGRPVIAVLGPDLQLFLHPGSGQIIAERDPSRTFYGVVEGIHRELLAGEIGSTVVAASTALLLVAILLGIWLWWPRTRAKVGSSFRLELRRGWKRGNYDLHNVLGFYSALVLFLLAATGVMLAYPELTRGLGRIVFPDAGGEAAFTTSGGQQSEESAADGTTPPAEPVIDAAAAHAAGEFPEAYHTTIRFPPRQGGPLRIIKATSAPPGAHTLAYDARTAEFLALTRQSEATTAQKANRLVGRIHLGTVYGWPTKLVAFLVCLVAGTLPITGAIVWYPRWRRKRRRRRARARTATSRHS